MRPISTSTQLPIKFKKIKIRKFPDSSVREMGQWLQSQKWNEVYSLTSPSQKAEKFESLLMEQVNLLFPEKIMKVKINDKPWVDNELQKIDRQRKREYNKRKKSEKWVKLNAKFLERAKMLKQTYYKNRVEDLKSSNISQWYSKLKRMSSIDQSKENEVEVEDLIQLPNHIQAEKIAEQFSSISNQYAPLQLEDISVNSEATLKPLPLFEPYQVHLQIKSMKKKKSTVLNDLPWKLIYEFSVELAEPLCHIFNSSLIEGIWPEMWKHEIVTPVPKVFPPKSPSDLRKIAGTRGA